MEIVIVILLQDARKLNASCRQIVLLSISLTTVCTLRYRTWLVIPAYPAYPAYSRCFLL